MFCSLGSPNLLCSPRNGDVSENGVVDHPSARLFCWSSECGRVDNNTPTRYSMHEGAWYQMHRISLSHAYPVKRHAVIVFRHLHSTSSSSSSSSSLAFLSSFFFLSSTHIHSYVQFRLFVSCGLSACAFGVHARSAVKRCTSRDGSVIPQAEELDAELFLQGQVVFEEFLKEIVAIALAKNKMNEWANQLDEKMQAATAIAAAVAAKGTGTASVIPAATTATTAATDRTATTAPTVVAKESDGP
jgi:hypothetical protein